MKLVSLKTPVMASWLREEGARLDAPPFLSDALEARFILKRLTVRTDKLSTLTRGHNGGIYNGPMFSRNYVNDDSHGVPFLGSSDMLLADLNNLPLLSRKLASSSRLDYLRLKEGMILVSCSGTIGRTVYVRRDMAGMWSSQHTMKIVPDGHLIRPGYLYSFLASKFGNAQLTAGTYGAIIQHIEPQHVASLSVPRFGEQLEDRVHRLVQEAATARSSACDLLKRAQSELFEVLRLRTWTPAHRYTHPLLGSCQSSSFAARGDGFYYAPMNIEARSAFDAARAQLKPLNEVADVFIPDIFKRLYADDRQYGYPYLTGAEVFELSPTSSKYLLRGVAEQNRLILRRGMIVVQEAGQLGGLIGRAVFVGQYLDGFACTNNMVRIVPKDPQDAGYIFAVLASEYGHRLIAREGAGSSIPHLESTRVASIAIPWASPRPRRDIAALIEKVVELRDQANAMELDAQQLLQGAIEGAI